MVDKELFDVIIHHVLVKWGVVVEDWFILKVIVKILSKDLLRGCLITFTFIKAEFSKTSSCTTELVIHIVQYHGSSDIGIPFLPNFEGISDYLLKVSRQGPLLVQWEVEDEIHLVCSVILLSSPTQLVF